MLLVGGLLVMSPVVPPLVAQAPDDGSAETAGEARRRIQQMLHDELLAQRKAWQDLEASIHGAVKWQIYDPASHMANGHCHDSIGWPKR